MGDEALLQLSIVANEKLEALRRRTTFHMFFAGLAFTILSFIGAHPIETISNVMKIAEIIALFAVMIAGILSLVG